MSRLSGVAGQSSTMGLVIPVDRYKEREGEKHKNYRYE